MVYYFPMVMRLVLSLLALTAGSPQDEEERLKGLVSSLQDDAIEVREKAVEELVVLGDQIVPSLQLLLTKETNVEARGRIRGALDRIEANKCRREFKGGKISNGLGALLDGKMDKEADAFLLRLQIINLSAQSNSFVLIRGWNKVFPDEIDYSTRSQAAIVVRQLTGERVNSYSSRFG